MLVGLFGSASAGRRVVIDPGHGGSNAGANGPGLHEKQLTLALATQVSERLRARGIEVVLTRAGDRTLTLRQRVAVANTERADVFVSIHANASPDRTQRGFETFVLSARGIDVDGRALRSGTPAPRPGIDPEIGLVLDDVERGAAQWEAADLAARVQRELRDRRGTAGDRGVRQEAHHVLLGATMPAILVEAGFISNPEEEARFKDDAYKDKVVEAIARAVQSITARP